MSLLKKITIYIMAIAYVFVGIQHFTNADPFLAIMPDYLPYHLEAVYFSGFCEIFFGILLLIPKYRSYAAWGLILLLLAVFPANIHLALNTDAQHVLNISQSTAIIRLPFQALFIGLAYWHTKKQPHKIV
jgi:uncharacterized membrane protein